MKQYVISVILVSAVTAIASALLPDGREKLRTEVDFALALVILAVLISPLGNQSSFVGNLGETLSGIFESDRYLGSGEEDEWLHSKREEAFREAIRYEIADRFGFSASEVEVDGTLAVREGYVYVTSLEVKLSGLAAAGDNKAVKKYLSELCEVECEVLLYP